MIDRRITPAEVWPLGWKEKLTDGLIAIGIDPATTTKEKSNPTGIAVVQKVGVDFIVRAVVRFKTDKPWITEEVLQYALDLPGRTVRRVVVLATNERFFAVELRRKLAGRVIVELVIESENTEYLGQKMNFKSYLGNLVVNTLEDAQLCVPSATWLRDDLRQTKRDKGGFSADPDETGNHADCFCAIGAALHGLITKSGPAQASAARVGGAATIDRHLRNPYAHKFGNQGVRLNA